MREFKVGDTGRSSAGWTYKVIAEEGDLLVVSFNPNGRAKLGWRKRDGTIPVGKYGEYGRLLEPTVTKYLNIYPAGSGHYSTLYVTKEAAESDAGLGPRSAVVVAKPIEVPVP